MTNQQSVRWHIYRTSSELVERSVAMILRAADQAIAARGEFLIVAAGGTTPERIYRGLADGAADWSRWRVYFGDERCLPADHSERNSVMAASAWLERAQTSGTQVFAMPAELGPDEGAARYRSTLAELGMFDLVLLGLGEDGHTASLFPGHAWGTGPDDPDVLPVRSAPKPPPERMSLSAARLSRARQVAVLITGAGKADAVAAWRSGHGLPISAVCPADGVDALLTADAWG